MVRLASATVALLLTLSNTLGVVAQDEPPVESSVSDVPFDGDVVVGFPAFNLTAAIASAESELGVNGTVTDNLPPDADAIPINPTTVRRLAKRTNGVPKSLLGSIACVALSIAFPTKVGLTGSSQYASWNNPSFWSSTTYMTPECVFRPTDADDISLAVRLFLLVQNDFNVVSGGHSAIKGWANAEDGVLIVLSGLTGVNVKNGYAEVSTGQRWGDTFTVLDKYKLAALGGRMSTVGVAGLTLGGGISYFTNKWGFVADQVKNFEVVLSSGAIVNANANENADLFRSLKGGSSNFGVVTRIDLYTWPSPAVYSGQLTFPQTDFAKLWDPIYNYHTIGALADPATHLISAFVFVGAYNMYLGAFTAFRNVTTADPGVALKPILDVNPSVTSASTLKVRLYGSQAIELGGGDVSGLRQDMRDFSVYANKALYQDCYAIWDKYMSAFKAQPAWLATIAFQPITKTAIAAGVARGGNALGLEGNTGTMAIINLTHQWSDSSIDTAVLAALDKVLAECIALAKSRGLYHPYYYLNYARKQDNPIGAYGTTSVNRLKAARNKYDPYSMFAEQVPGGFKIPI